MLKEELDKVFYDISIFPEGEGRELFLIGCKKKIIGLFKNHIKTKMPNTYKKIPEIKDKNNLWGYYNIGFAAGKNQAIEETTEALLKELE